MSEDPANWKDKYYDLAERKEQEAKHFAEAEQVLTRAIVRLTVATTGLDPELDPYLRQLNKAAKQGFNPELRQQIDELADALVRAGESPQKVNLFALLLERMSLDKRKAQEATRLWERLSRLPQGVDDAEVDRLIELILGEAPTANREEPHKPGLLGRLFGGGGEGHAALEPGNQAALAGVREAGDHEQGLSNRALHDVLCGLKWPGEVGEEVRGLCEQLLEEPQPEAWVNILQRVGELLIAALSDAQAEVRAAEDFLTDLTDRLQELDVVVQGNRELREESLRSGEALTRAMDEQAVGISDSMQKATDLAQLKDSVAQHLDVIRTHVSRHLGEDMERHRKASEREDSLRDKIRQLEHEGEGLRAQIADAQKRAFKDAVTGLPNRMAYDERIEQEYARWRRFHAPLVLLVWDIDNFKSINDQFGHRAGDKALRVIGQVLHRRLRETDFIARYGGEEFVMLLAGAPLAEAVRLADEMREAVSHAGLHSRKRKIGITISCGISDFREGDEPQTVFERADQALYKAKREGKNRCIAV